MNDLIGNVPAVFLFELRRAAKPVQMMWWIALAGFPVFMIGMIRTIPIRRALSDEVWSLLLYGLVPVLISMLGTFQWTTTTVSGELEEKSWVYLSVRPGGVIAVLLGKFLAAITWVWAAAITGLTVATMVSMAEDKFAIWWPVAIVTTLSVPAYAALYTCLGCLFPKRAMVLGIAYSLGLEMVISLVPAMINKFTIQYRLRSLWFQWADITENVRMSRGMRRQFEALMSDETQLWMHLLILASIVVVAIALAVWTIRVREFSHAEEPDI